MRPGTVLRLSLAGSRTDRLRTVLTAFSAALASLALLAAATVAAIRGGDMVQMPDGAIVRDESTRHYASLLLVEAGLRPGVVFALAVLALPVLALAGQCIRLGAPARDRRLAALRLNGATPRQAILIAGAETVLAGVLGSLTGFGIYLLLRVVLERRDEQGRLLLPTDVLPGPVTIAVLLTLVPVLAGVIGATLMRRVVVTPLGVVRRLRGHGPRPWPGLAIAAGLLLVALPGLLPDRVRLGDRAIAVCLIAGLMLTMAGVVLGVGWVSHVAGRVLVRFGRRPSLLLAGRRLMADPWNGSRTMGAMLAAVIAGTLALGVRATFETQFEANRRLNELTGAGFGTPADPDFYLGAVDLVMLTVAVAMLIAAAGLLVALADGIVARRRTYAALTAAGVPRRSLAEALLAQTFAPLVPAVLLAIGSGVALFRTMVTEVEAGGGSTVAQSGTETVIDPLVVLPVPVPVAELALLGGGTALLMLGVAGVGMLVMRSSTDLEELRIG